MQAKRIVFEGTDVLHAATILRLRQLKISQGAFFRFFLEKFVNESECLESFVERLVSDVSPLGKRSVSTLTKYRAAGKENISSLNLSMEEREEIFDILELENFD